MKKEKHRYGKTKTNKQELYREKKREKALAMQAEYEKLSTQQKIDKLNLGKFTAKKQRERLAAQLLEEKQLHNQDK